MNAEEQEEPILRLHTLSGGRTGLGKWKVNAASLHESPQRPFPLDGPLDHKMSKGRAWRSGKFPGGSLLALGQVRYSALMKLQLAFTIQQRKGERKSPLLPLRSHC